MRIIALIKPNSGPCLHRIENPLLYMGGVDCHITNVLSTEQFIKGCDVFMYNRTMPDSWLIEVIRLRKAFGFKICVDIDDYWELDEHHILFEDYIKQGFAATQVAHLRNADFITTTNERLASVVQQVTDKPIHILPNSIPAKGQFDIERVPHYLTRILWQGSITHEADLDLLKEPVKKLAGIAGKIKMMIAGWSEGYEAWDNMAATFTADFKHQYKIIPGVTVDKYYANYAEADICLVPLINSPFNRCKSNLKVLEAAHLGLPVICSNVHPYKDLPVLYANNSGDWVKHITRLAGSRKRQKEAGQELKEYCDTLYNFEKINRERKQIFEYQSKKEIA